MPTLSPRLSFWTAAAVAGIVLWSSGAPTIVYPLYAATWHLTPAVTTLIFAIYPLALIPILFIFGNLSDFIGRRAAILIGLFAMLLGTAAFGVAPDLAWVLVGRVLMGAGVGFALSPATAAMIEFGGPTRAHRASSTTTASTATGLALATLVGGALVQYGPAPLHLTFWVLVVVIVLVGAAAFFLPRHTPDEARGHWAPRLPAVPRGLRREFLAGATAISSAYAVGAVFLALGAQIARQLVRSDNALVDGAIISISAVTIGVVAILSRKLAPVVSMTIGPFAMAVGLACLIGAATWHSIVWFIVASLLTGTGYSLMFSGGLGIITATAPAHHRAAVISAAYMIAYLVQAAAALGLGAVATASGLLLALELGSIVLVALAVAAVLLARLRRTPVPRKAIA